jgi:lipopolysaccharide transport system permease protein
MSETVYHADSELLHPRRFLADAAADLRHSLPVAWQLFARNLQIRHRRAWLGYVWLLLPTVATTLLWIYVHSRRLVNIAPTAIPYPVYVLAGTVLWQVFVDALNAPLQQLAAARQLITRSRVPHEALLLSGLLEVLFNAAVRMLVLAAVLVGYRIAPGTSLLFVPFGIAALALFGTMLGIFAAPLGMLYDDVGRALTLLTSFWFFLTPVIYPAPTSGILRWNPVTPLLDTTRQWLTGAAASNAFSVVATATIPALAAAWLVHRLARPHVIARLG